MKQLPLHRYTSTSLDALSDAEAVAYTHHTTLLNEEALGTGQLC